MEAREYPVRFLEENVVYEGRWLTTRRLVVAKDMSQGGIREVWEVVDRKKQGATEAHGVYIIPILTRKKSPSDSDSNSNSDSFVILEKQFRIPMRSYVLEFPGGFIQEGETAAETAVRELWEETGYSGEVIRVSEGICTEGAPCMNNTFKAVTVLIDGDKPENVDPKQNLPTDELEYIEIIKLPLEGLEAALKDFSTQGIYIMGELYTFAIGLETFNLINQSINK